MSYSKKFLVSFARCKSIKLIHKECLKRQESQTTFLHTTKCKKFNKARKATTSKLLAILLLFLLPSRQNICKMDYGASIFPSSMHEIFRTYPIGPCHHWPPCEHVHPNSTWHARNIPFLPLIFCNHCLWREKSAFCKNSATLELKGKEKICLW